jgi:uncharacterized protein YdbL (DUF1318 family)
MRRPARTKEKLLAAIETLGQTELMLLHEHLLLIQKEKQALVLDEPTQAGKVREALSGIGGQLSETISTMRDERL